MSVPGEVHWDSRSIELALCRYEPALRWLCPSGDERQAARDPHPLFSAQPEHQVEPDVPPTDALGPREGGRAVSAERRETVKRAVTAIRAEEVVAQHGIPPDSPKWAQERALYDHHYRWF